MPLTFSDKQYCDDLCTFTLTVHQSTQSETVVRYESLLSCGLFIINVYMSAVIIYFTLTENLLQSINWLSCGHQSSFPLNFDLILNLSSMSVSSILRTDYIRQKGSTYLSSFRT